MKGPVIRAVFLALWLWQLPQNLLGLLMVHIYGWVVPIDWMGDSRYRRLPSSLIFLTVRIQGGISLGRYVILNRRSYLDVRSVQHERGHSIQSMILGPLYLIIVGLPSLLWAAWWNEGRGVSYYWFYTERWADRLGGIER